MAGDAHRSKRVKHEDTIPKPQMCRVCYTAIEGPYLTPCLSCRKPCCHGCLTKQFEMALKDKEVMPSRCCRRIFYHKVAQGILDPADLELYKQRYDESITSNPFYCPKPTCSTFIPPRNLNPVRGKVTCHLCNTVACFKCKQIADPITHACVRSTEEDEMIEQFGYKRCPKCGTAAMKMYGCPHVRCNNCGAHFCWDCLRPINICNVKPCARARDDGEMSEPDEGDSLSADDGEESTDYPFVNAQPTSVAEQASVSLPHLPQQLLDSTVAPRAAVSDTDLIRSLVGSVPRESQYTDVDTLARYSAITTPTISAPPRTAGPPEPPEPTGPIASPPAAASEQESTDNATSGIANLDDPHRADVDWENTDEFNFGDEPTDEDWDTWGCLHRFDTLTMAKIPDNWLTGLDKSKIVRLECMGCFKEMRIHPLKRTNIENDKENIVPDTGVSNVTRPADGLDAAIGSDSNENNETVKEEKIVDDRKMAKENKKKAVYDCADCGVIFCWWCRRVALRRAEKYRRAAEQEVAATNGN